MSDVLICSFYTPGGYYEECAEKLSSDVNALGLDLQLRRMEVPSGKTWPQICRLKVPFVQEVRHANPGKLLFWIDVDCRLQGLPDFIHNTTADLIGFQRGFGQPLSIGYSNKSRFWEPCFFGFGRSDKATAFIDFAAAAERAAEFDATDDYFFEEAWRSMAAQLTYQLIPSEISKPTHPERFFVFGSSSNVAKYRGKVRQHEAPPGQAKAVSRRPSRMVSTMRHLALRYLPEPAIGAIVAVKKRRRERLAQANIAQMAGGAPGAATGRTADRSEQLQAFNTLVKQSVAFSGEPMPDSVARMADALGPASEDVVQSLEWGQAFRDYRNRPDTGKTADLVWWDTPSPGNFGDWLSPYIFGGVGNTSIRYVKPGSRPTAPHILGLGSIVKFAQANTIVMGSGIAERRTRVDPEANYVFVRGRHTADRITASGGRAPELFGDPAIVLSKLYAPEVPKEAGSVALVRHIRHLPLDMKLPSYMEEISIWGARPHALEHFIRRILAKDFVVTSAMHCFIACQSYGIPCALVTFEGFENVVPGDGVKYLDYLNGVGLPEVLPHHLPTDLRAVDLQNYVRTERVSAGQIDEIFATIEMQMTRLADVKGMASAVQ